MSAGVGSTAASDSVREQTRPERPLRILHVISGLGVGGAEAMLRKLVMHSLEYQDPPELDHAVVSLSDLGPIGNELSALGSSVYALNLRRSTFDGVRGAMRQAGALRAGSADVVHGWMYHGNLVASILSRGASSRVAWNIRASGLGRGERVRTHAVLRLGAVVSQRMRPAIVVNSASARDAHVALGYPAERFTIIPNGFDLSHFRRDETARMAVRDALQIQPEAFLIGMIARMHPVKGHDIFVRAAATLLERMPRAFFLLAGDGTDTDVRLRRQLAAAGIESHFRLLGRRDDTPRLFSALDVCTLSSTGGESLPNVLGEAMACEVPCVASAVGGCGELLGDTGVLVPPGDADALVEAWWRWAGHSPEERRAAGAEGRRRIERHFSLERVARMYQEFYELLVRQRHPS